MGAAFIESFSGSRKKHSETAAFRVTSKSWPCKCQELTPVPSPHQAPDTSPTTRLVASLQFDRDPPRAVSSPVFPEDGSNHWSQTVVFALPVAALVLSPGVVRRATYVKRFAQQRHRVLFLVELVDDHVDFVYVLWLKMAKAFFKTSRSRSTRRSSCSS